MKNLKSWQLFAEGKAMKASKEKDRVSNLILEHLFEAGS